MIHQIELSNNQFLFVSGAVGTAAAAEQRDLSSALIGRQATKLAWLILSEEEREQLLKMFRELTDLACKDEG